jgi:hypothetical protein
MGKNKSIQSYKGFDKNMQCRGFQFEEGMEYKHDGPVVACESGFHACENPLDVLFYYPPTNGNRYAETEQSGKLSHHEQDSKLASERIKIKAEINLTSIISAAVNFVCEKTKSIQESNAATTGNRANAATTGNRANAATTGNRANAATTGNRANAATTGEYANAATTGYRANAATTGEGSNAATTGNDANAATTGNRANAATTGNRANAATTGNRANAATTGEGSNAATTGEESISAGLGIENAAKGVIGNWLVLAEWYYDDNKWHIKSVKSSIVDGKKIKADTFYTLKNGKFVEAKS